jgi:hypothetical protein
LRGLFTVNSTGKALKEFSKPGGDGNEKNVFSDIA